MAIKGENWIPHVVGLISLSRGRRSAFKAGHFNCCVTSVESDKRSWREKKREKARRITANVVARGYFTVILYRARMPKQFHFEVFHIPGTFPIRDIPFPYAGGRNVASGNEILPKLVGAADQADLTSLETAVVSSIVRVYLKRTPTDHESIVLVASGVSLLLFHRTVEIHYIRRIRSTFISEIER